MNKKNNPRTSMNTLTDSTLLVGADSEHEFLIEEVKKKKEFSGLPNSVVKRALKESGNDIKEARKLLRKYFGVFLTNRVLRFTRSQVAGCRSQDMLGLHISSKKRDYQKFYEEIFERIRNQESEIRVGSVVDLGCGANGFSYEYLPGAPEYIGIEAAGQLVDQMNVYFRENDFNARAVCGDLFDLDLVVGALKKAKKDRVVFLFQVVDALESVEKNFSLKLIDEIMKESEVLVISVPLVSLGGRKKFAVKRKWLMDYLEENFKVDKDFEMFGERILVIRKGI